MSIVVAGVDDSPVSKEVLRKAIEQASWRRAELHVVHVVRTPVVYTELTVDITEIIEAERRTVWERLESTLSGAGLTVRRVDLDGYPPDALVEYASQEGAVLLVVATRGRGEIASLILGSTSHRAIQLAPCDVLVVKGTLAGDRRPTEDEGSA
jgi:nucleotide-binding universal stress UspA family protein